MPSTPARDEQDGDLGLERNGDRKQTRGDRPLKPVLHAELRQAPAGMQDQGDDRRTDPVENRGHPGQAAEMDVERTERGDDQEVGQDKRPAAGPRTPKAAAQIGDEDSDLDRERARQRLADGDRVAHLLRVSQRRSSTSSFSISPTERDRPAEAERPEPQEVEVSSIREPRGLAVTPVAFAKIVITRRQSTVVASFQLSYVD